MERRSRLVFLFLILAQCAHSIEEYVTGLYEVFAPARFISSLISNDLALGFLVANAALVTFGLWCWAVPVRSGWRAARELVWFWTILELGNGINHSALALWRGAYFPGVATAPLLLLPRRGWRFSRFVRALSVNGLVDELGATSPGPTGTGIGAKTQPSALPIGPLHCPACRRGLVRTPACGATMDERTAG